MTWDAHTEHKQQAEFNRERFDNVLGDKPEIVGGIGKHEALNIHSLKSVYEEAKTACPRAADTIAWFLWHSIIHADRLALLSEGQNVEKLLADNTSMKEALELIGLERRGLQSIQEEYPDTNAYNYHAKEYFSKLAEKLQLRARKTLKALEES